MRIRWACFFLLLCASAATKVVHGSAGFLSPQQGHEETSLVSRNAHHPLLLTALTGKYVAAAAEPGLGEMAGSHLHNYAMILGVIAIGICLCCCLTVSGTAVAVGVVVHKVLNTPFVQVLFEQSKRQEELPDEVKIHVNSEEFRLWSEDICEKKKGGNLTEIIKEIFGAELAKDAFFVKTYKGESLEKYDTIDLMLLLQYFETIQWIQNSKISLPRLGVKLPPKPLPVEQIQEARFAQQAELPENIQKHVESSEFTEFCLQAFMKHYQDDPQPRQTISMQRAALAVAEVYPVDELMRDPSLKIDLKADIVVGTDSFREVFMLFECLLYTKIGMTSLSTPGVKVPRGWRAKKPSTQQTVDVVEAPTPAIQDA